MKRDSLKFAGIVCGSMALSLGALTGCGSSQKSAPDPGGSPGSNSAVIQLPVGFRNVAFTCFGPNGVYVTSHGVATSTDLPSSVFVVPNDSKCGGK